MNSDERLYELAMRELVTNPRAGLLAKCAVQCDGDMKKAKLDYVRIRVREIKEEEDKLLKQSKDREAAALREEKLEQERKQRDAILIVEREIANLDSGHGLNRRDILDLADDYMTFGTFNDRKAASMIAQRKVNNARDSRQALIVVAVMVILAILLSVLASL